MWNSIKKSTYSSKDQKSMKSSVHEDYSRLGTQCKMDT